MSLRRVLCLGVLWMAVPAVAQTVYKCEENGKITYTDQPCAPGARSAPLPEVIVVQPPSRTERDLARAYEARMARERGDRDRADAEWLKEHGRRADREARVRKAIIEHRVIKGMTTGEVRQALGEPERVSGGESFGSAKETWTYVADGRTRTVNFKNGEVISTAAGRKKRR